LSPEEAEVLRRFDLWLAIKLRTNNHVALVRGVLKSETKDFLRGWDMAMIMTSTWLNAVANGNYDTNKYNLKFDTLENLEAKWDKV